MTSPGSAEPVHLEASLLRTAGVALAAASFVVGCGAALWTGAFPGGSYKQFAMVAGVLLGAFGLLAIVLNLRRGPVVSIGPDGIFDRRLSTAPIGWDAIEALDLVTIRRVRLVQMRLRPEREHDLPLTARARRNARSSAGFGIPGHSLVSTTLAGGYPGLIAALRHWAPGRLEVPSARA